MSVGETEKDAAEAAERLAHEVEIYPDDAFADDVRALLAERERLLAVAADAELFWEKPYNETRRNALRLALDALEAP